MASLDKETNVGIHEGRLHGDVLSVRKDCSLISSALLDEAEDVVPSRDSDCIRAELSSG